MKRHSHIQKIDYRKAALLLSVVFSIFITPLFNQGIEKILYPVSFTIILIMGVLSLNAEKKKLVLALAISALLTEWLTEAFDFLILHTVSKALNFAFFIYVLIKLIEQIAKSKVVNTNVILESIIGYLMLGLIYMVIIGIIEYLMPGSFSFVTNPVSPSEICYYTFVTLSTLGYGDVLPLNDWARSVSILTTISGQFYLAILVALLVGKFSSQKNYA